MNRYKSYESKNELKKTNIKLTRWLPKNIVPFMKLGTGLHFLHIALHTQLVDWEGLRSHQFFCLIPSTSCKPVNTMQPLNLEDILLLI